MILMKIWFTSKGRWERTFRFLHRLSEQDYLDILNECGRQGVEALSAATPKDSGLTASCWGYELVRDKNLTTITWTNSNMGDGWFPVAIMLQYGHGTGTGGYVQGRDYINPAIRPVFDQIADTVWNVVTSANV